MVGRRTATRLRIVSYAGEPFASRQEAGRLFWINGSRQACLTETGFPGKIMADINSSIFISRKGKEAFEKIGLIKRFFEGDLGLAKVKRITRVKPSEYVYDVSGRQVPLRSSPSPYVRMHMRNVVSVVCR
jgi:hypothetical protein